ncbi:hypothetical protein GCM10029963_34250 [Micromonospora andamanensis]
MVVFFFYGRLARWLDQALTGPPASLAVAFTVVFAAFQIGLLRGPLGAQIPFVGAALVVLVIGIAAWQGPQWGVSRPPTSVEGRSIPPVAPAAGTDGETGRRLKTAEAVE